MSNLDFIKAFQIALEALVIFEDGKIDEAEEQLIIDRYAPMVAELYDAEDGIPVEQTRLVKFAVNFVNKVIDIINERDKDIYDDIPLPEKVK